MHEMAKSMNEVAKAMKSTSSSSPKSSTNNLNSDPQSEAIAYIERQGDLSETEFAEAFDLFVSNRDFAKAYMKLETEYARANVLRHKLEKMGRM
jgi:hypothetical protein